METSSALRTHGIWSSTISGNAAPVETAQPAIDPVRRRHVTDTEVRGTCRKCNATGHLTYECRNNVVLAETQRPIRPDDDAVSLVFCDRLIVIVIWLTCFCFHSPSRARRVCLIPHHHRHHRRHRVNVIVVAIALARRVVATPPTRLRRRLADARGTSRPRRAATRNARVASPPRRVARARRSAERARPFVFRLHRRCCHTATAVGHRCRSIRSNFVCKSVMFFVGVFLQKQR